MHTVVQ